MIEDRVDGSIKFGLLARPLDAPDDFARPIHQSRPQERIEIKVRHRVSQAVFVAGLEIPQRLRSEIVLNRSQARADTRHAHRGVFEQFYRQHQVRCAALVVWDQTDRCALQQHRQLLNWYRSQKRDLLVEAKRRA